MIYNSSFWFYTYYVLRSLLLIPTFRSIYLSRCCYLVAINLGSFCLFNGNSYLIKQYLTIFTFRSLLFPCDFPQQTYNNLLSHRFIPRSLTYLLCSYICTKIVQTNCKTGGSITQENDQTIINRATNNKQSWFGNGATFFGFFLFS